MGDIDENIDEHGVIEIKIRKKHAKRNCKKHGETKDFKISVAIVDPLIHSNIVLKN